MFNICCCHRKLSSYSAVRRACDSLLHTQPLLLICMPYSLLPPQVRNVYAGLCRTVQAWRCHSVSYAVNTANHALFVVRDLVKEQARPFHMPSSYCTTSPLFFTKSYRLRKLHTDPRRDPSAPTEACWPDGAEEAPWRTPATWQGLFLGLFATRTAGRTSCVHASHCRRVPDPPVEPRPDVNPPDRSEQITV